MNQNKNVNKLLKVRIHPMAGFYNIKRCKTCFSGATILEAVLLNWLRGSTVVFVF